MPKTYAQAKAALQADEYASTISGQIERIEDSKVVIVQKLHDMKDEETTITLDEAALSLDAVTVTRSGSHSISPGDSYTLPSGYYSGYSVVADGATHDYDLETGRSVTPTKSSQTVTPGTNPSTGNAYYGLASVTVAAIPAAYQDVTGVTATQADVKVGSYFVDDEGNLLQGTMVNNGAVSEVLTAHKTSGSYDDYSYTIPAGYHNGSGTVSISLETVNVIPTESAQTIDPTNGKVIGQVTVAAIDKSSYLTNWTSDATAVAGDILDTKTAYVNGSKIVGSMVNNSTTWDGEQSAPIDHTLTAVAGSTSITVPAGYHNGYGVVKVVPEDKTVSWSDITSHSNAWTITASSGKVLREISIAGKPANWVDTTTATGAVAGDILASKHAFVNGAEITGTISTVTSYTTDVTDEILASGSSATTTLDSFNEAFYKNGGTVTITNAIYNRLAAI